MKKIFYIVCLLAINAVNTFAQNEHAESAISCQIGLSYGSDYMTEDFNYQLPTKVSGTNTPSIMFTWDYAIMSWMSIGGTFSYNNSKLEVTKGNGSGEKINWNGDGYGVGSRVLVHFLGNSSDKIDVYAGAGLHMVAWSYEADPDNYANTAAAYDATKLYIGLPLTLGGRYYFSENFGVTAEASTNKISRLNAGITLKF
ncbi:MAG: outer membrane beta-barrel protein [Bacteroidota bacterium]